MKRPERQFWIYISLLASVFLLLLGGPLISCAEAKKPHTVRPDYHGGKHGTSHTAPWNHGRPSVSAQPGVSIKAQLDRSAVLRGSDGTVRVEVNLETRPDSGPHDDVESDIVVVVDTSGSMEGEKLYFARQAILSLIDRLNPGDRLALVEYSSRAHVLAPLTHPRGSSREHLRNLAHNLHTTGSTNLSEGLDRGSEILRTARHLGRPGRLLLLSDGLANAGDSSLSGLNARARRLTHDGFALSTMGIGEDFDEGVMTSLATNGTGAFYYLSRLEYLTEFFGAELKSAQTTYAQNAILKFVPAAGVVLESAMGLPMDRSGNRHSVRLGNLYAGRSRTVWLTLRVPTYRLGETQLGRLSLSYHKNGDENLVSVGALPQVACLTDEGIYRKRINRSIWERALIENVFTRTEEDFGDAIRTGSKADLNKALTRAKKERRLAESLGSTKVIQELEVLESEAKKAAVAQRAPAKARNKSAKKKKASGYQKRNKSMYQSADRAMKAY